MPAALVENFSVAASIFTEIDLVGGVDDGSSAFTVDKVVSAGTRRILLKTAAANNSSVSGYKLYRYALPKSYVPDAGITVRVNANVDVNPAVSRQVDVEVFKVGADGQATGSDLCTTGIQSITTSAANYDFAVSGAGLTSADALYIVVRVALDDTGGSSDHFGFLNRVSIGHSAYGGI